MKFIILATLVIGVALLQGQSIAAAPVGYTYAGCPMFPGTAGGKSGGWYNTDIYNAPVAKSIRASDGVTASSAQLIANFASANAGTFNVWSAAEVINTPANIRLFPISGCPAQGVPTTCSMPGPAAQWSGRGMPSLPNLFWEIPNGDNHYNVLETSTCKMWTATVGSYSNGAFKTWDSTSGFWDTRKPFPQPGHSWSAGIGGAVAGTCCGLPVAAFSIKPQEFQVAIANRAYLPHALGWSAPGNEVATMSPEDPNGFVPPAASAQGSVFPNGCSTAGPCMPYGAHIRLKPTYNDSAWSPAAKVVAETLKHYGAYLFDTGCCHAIGYLVQDNSGININNLWTAADGGFMKKLQITDFDVISPADSNAPN